MPQRYRNNLASFLSEPNTDPTKSRNPFTRKKKLMLVKIKVLMGCKGTSHPASTPSVIRSAAEWEANNNSRRKYHMRKNTLQNQRNPGNVAVDFPNVCCTPPGIGIASDFAPRTRTSRFCHRKYSRAREAGRNGDDPAVAIIGHRPTHRSAEEIIEMLMAQQTLMSERILQRQDRYQNWRLNVDDMSYEELLELSDKIGYVGTGLQEEQISRCLRKLNHSDSSSWLAGQKNWKCSICQEKYKRDDEVGRLDCGHYHHMKCIKQWLVQKNECPVCKSTAAKH